MSENKSVSYDHFIDLCEKAGKRHGNILDWPIGPHPYQYVKDALEKDYKGGRILDFGCGAKKPQQLFVGIDDAKYFTCDSDPSGVFSYDLPVNIPDDEMFEIVTANHVLEHLTFDDGIAVVKELAKHLKPGGIFEICVPNQSHPTRYLSSPVHVTPWNYLNLCAVMQLAGLDPAVVYRHNKFPAPNIFMRPLVNYLCRTFRIDWADAIYVVGRKQDI